MHGYESFYKAIKSDGINYRREREFHNLTVDGKKE